MLVFENGSDWTITSSLRRLTHSAAQHAMMFLTLFTLMGMPSSTDIKNAEGTKEFKYF